MTKVAGLMSAKNEPHFDARWEFITPAVAQSYLPKNIKNRSLSKDTARYKYGEDMAHGRWKPNPNAGISFSAAGDLQDGQHRLEGVIYAETVNPDFKGVWMMVHRGVPEEVRAVIDIGRARSCGDVLTMEGHPHGGLAAAAANIILNYLDGSPITGIRSKAEKNEFCLKNPALFRYATLAAATGKAALHSAMAAVLFLGTRADPEGLEDLAEAFARGIATSDGLRYGDPRLALRGYILNSRSGKKLDRIKAISATVTGWNAFLMNRTDLTAIRVQPDVKGRYPISPIMGGPEPGSVGNDDDYNAKLAEASIPPKARTLIEQRLNMLAKEQRAAEREAEAEAPAA